MVAGRQLTISGSHTTTGKPACYNQPMPRPPLAKKSLGQHWLNDDTMLAAIAEAAQLSPDDTVLEIGPGTGNLTRVLLGQAGQVIAVEKDERLAQQLRISLPSAALQIITGDIMTYDLNRLPRGYKIVANIPYYLTSHLLRYLSTSTNPPVRAVLLIQKEVAERVNASAGEASLLSISVQYYWQVELGTIVPAHCFTPPPKVDSQILILKRRLGPLFPEVNEKVFFQIVRAGFSERRKKIKSSLSGGLRLDKPLVTEILHAADINPDLRAQAVSLQQWYELYLHYIGRFPTPSA